MAPHSSTLAWKIPGTEEPGGLQSRVSRRVGHDWETSLSLFPFMHWRRKQQPTPVFLPGESQGQGSLVGCHLWGCIESGHDWSDLAAAAAGNYGIVAVKWGQEEDERSEKLVGSDSQWDWSILKMEFWRKQGGKRELWLEKRPFWIENLDRLHDMLLGWVAGLG